jgi:RNA polymerase sigma-70 factor, ECF subfamily
MRQKRVKVNLLDVETRAYARKWRRSHLIRACQVRQGCGEAADAAENSPRRAHRTAAGRRFTPELPTDRASQFDVSRQIENEIPFLRRAVRRWHHEHADADDLVQDTLLRALANAHLFEPGSDLRAWLFTIMRNQFLAGAAKANRFISMLRVFAETDHGAGGDPGETRLVLRDVAGALRRLPSKQRIAVMLACVDGKSYEEVAEAMGLSVSAVRCHLARGRNRLRTAIEADQPRSLFAPRPVKQLPSVVSPLVSDSAPTSLVPATSD